MFKPKNANSSGNGKREFDPNRKFPVPKGGSRPARCSLIIDLGVQERPDYKDPVTKQIRPQQPAQQLAIFADLPNDVVDYGGEIGSAPYRICLNNTFEGKLIGVNFIATPPKDGNGNLISGKPWTWHPQSLLTKLAKATKELATIEDMDPTPLLDKPFMAQIDVKKTEDKNGKKDADGNVIVYTNINFKGASEVPMIEDDDGNEKLLNVKPLTVKPLLITFDDAKAEDIKFIRRNIIEMIKLAKNYAGSQMQKAIEQFESTKNAQQEASEDAGEEFVPEVKETPKPAAKKAPVAAKKVVEPVEDDDVDDQSPF